MAGTEQQWRRMGLMRGAEDSIFPWLVEHSDAKTLAAGELLLSPQKSNRHIYLVVKGQLSVRLNSITEKAVATIEPGECTGEVSVLDAHLPSAWVSAVTATELLVLNRDQLWGLIEESHALSRNLLYVMSRRLRSYRHLVNQQAYQANTDALTGVHNRRWLDENLPRALATAQQSQQPLALLMVDADLFKQFNDRYGHGAGDDALRQLAVILQHSLRGSDAVVRYGGEEFTVLLPRSDDERALAVAERIRAMAAATVLEITGVEPATRLTVSIGVAIADIDQPLSDSELLHQADQALYQAKSAGRNRVQRFTDSMV